MSVETLRGTASRQQVEAATNALHQAPWTWCSRVGRVADNLSNASAATLADAYERLVGGSRHWADQTLVSAMCRDAVAARDMVAPPCQRVVSAADRACAYAIGIPAACACAVVQILLRRVGSPMSVVGGYVLGAAVGSPSQATRAIKAGQEFAALVALWLIVGSSVVAKQSTGVVAGALNTAVAGASLAAGAMVGAMRGMGSVFWDVRSIGVASRLSA